MIDFTKLDPMFTPLLHQLINNMESLGHTVNPYYGIRTLRDQAKIWRRSRTLAEVNALTQKLVDAGANYAVSTLLGVGPQPMGSWGTNTFLYSYHLIGEACDMFIDGDTAGGAVYDVLAKEAIKLGLTPGRNFSHPDSGHIQLRSEELSKTYSMKEMNDILKELNNEPV